MRNQPRDNSIYLDANGCLTERVVLNGQEVIVHYDDIPDSDLTTVQGIPCTTPLRTVIDVAADAEIDGIEHMVRHCLDRGLFTRDEALRRIAEPDIRARAGARLLGQILER